MATKQIRLSNLLGGVSRQDDSLRHDNQVQEADNCLMAISRGLTKRPGSHMAFAVPGLVASTPHGIHAIDRDGSEQYLVVYRQDVLEVFEPDGTVIPVSVHPDAATYLALNDPAAAGLRLETIADYTLILNTLALTDAIASDPFVVDVTHIDFDSLISFTPAIGTYHRTENATGGHPAGHYHQYIPDGCSFPTWTGSNMIVNWRSADENWDRPAPFNPVGFKLQVTDGAGVQHDYNCVTDFFADPETTMQGIAARFQQIIRDAGGTDTCVYWDPPGNVAYGRFIFTGGFCGTAATVVDITTPDGAGVVDLSTTVIVLDTAVAGSGNPASDTIPVLSRWVESAAPDQPEAVPDPDTMPVQMVSNAAPIYSTTVISCEPFGYWRLGEPSGTDAVNEVAGDDGTYVNTPTLGVTGALAGDPDTAVTFNGSDEYVNVGALGSFGSSWNQGMAVEFWFKTTSTADEIITGYSQSGFDGAFNVYLNRAGAGLDAGHLRAQITDDAGDQVIAYTTSTHTYSDNAWHHLVVNFKTSTSVIEIWLDGTSLPLTYAANPSLGTFNDLVNDVYLGATTNNGAAANHYDGSLDEFAFWIGTLSEYQITKHYNQGVSAFTFDVNTIDWHPRHDGDEDTNPAPSIWTDNRAIADIAFHRNRLVLAGHENIVLSQSGDFFNYYIEDATNIGDSDPIDVSLTAGQITLIDHVIPFRKALVTFTLAGQQFEMNAPEVLTPNTVAITPSTQETSIQGVRPATMGSHIYFPAVVDGGALFEYGFTEAQAADDTTNVSAHIAGYLPENIQTIRTVPNLNMVLVLPESGSEVFMYQQHWRGDEKVQSSWMRMTVDDAETIVDFDILTTNAYMLIENDDGYFVVRQPLIPEGTDTDMPTEIHLDNLKMVTGVNAANVTTWTYTVEDDTTDTVVLGPDFATPGVTVSGTVNATSTTVTVADTAGAYAGNPCYVGRTVPMTVQFSPVFTRDRNGAALLDASLQIRTLHVHHGVSGDFNVQVEQSGRTTWNASFTAPSGSVVGADGTFRAHVHGKTTDTTLSLISDSAYPAIFLSAEYTVLEKRRR